MTRATKYAALDVHQATTLASVRTETGHVIARTVLPTEPRALTEFFRAMRGAIGPRGRSFGKRNSTLEGVFEAGAQTRVALALAQENAGGPEKRTWSLNAVEGEDPGGAHPHRSLGCEPPNG